MLESRHRSSPRASASSEATNCDHTLFLSANQGFFYSLNAMHKALAKREAICQSSTQSVRALMQLLDSD
jgi:hypothetical protein